MTEEWRPVAGYEDIYIISNLGNVRRVGRFAQGKNLKLVKQKSGYLAITLNVKGVVCKRLHRLLAQAFIPNPGGKLFVNHKNGVKDDNRIENLEWVTPSENSKHALLSRTSHRNRKPRGVYQRSKTCWRAVIGIDGEKIRLGNFESREDGLAAYRLRFIEHYGFEPWSESA